MNEGTKAPAQELQFVYVTQASANDRKRNTKLARAHAAKLNRDKYKEKLAANRRRLETVDHPEGLIEANEELVQRIERLDIEDYPKLEVRAVLDEHLFLGRQTWTHECDDPVQCSECSQPRAHRKAQVEQRLLGKQVQLGISTALDALPPEVREWSLGSMSSKARHHLLNTSWPILAGTGAARAWFEQCCSSRLIFHACHVAAAFHRDLLEHRDLLPGQRSEAPWSSDRDILQHKGAALAIIQQQVRSLHEMSPAEIDQLIFAIVTLGRHESSVNPSEANTANLFSPHFPAANWAGLYGRVKSVKAHIEAATGLVKYLGGLSGVKTAGVASTIARIDLVESSAEYRRPLYANFWDSVPSDLFRVLSGEPVKVVGTGFGRLASQFPPSTLEVFQDLATLDLVMSRARMQELSEATLQHIMTVRNCIGHRLVSLPRWDDLDEDTRMLTNSRTYGLAHLTCVIYQNAIMLSLFPNRGWQNGLTARLRFLLSVQDAATVQDEGVDDLVLWSLCVGAIASHQGRDSGFFQDSLQTLLLKRYDEASQQFTAVTAILHNFVWSDEACKQGFQIVWDATFKE